jgi:hypothetical protein
MLAARKKGPPEIAFQTGADGDRARKEYGDWYTEIMRREWYSTGIHLGFSYYHSPVIYPDHTPDPPDEISNYVQTARPGHRAPHAWLKDGRSTLDLFGRGFVLLSFAPAIGVTRAFAAAARERGLPLHLVDLSGETAVRALYGADYVLVRPDGHVAWRGDAQHDNIGQVLDTVRGFGSVRPNTQPAEVDRSVTRQDAVAAGSAH